MKKGFYEELRKNYISKYLRPQQNIKTAKISKDTAKQMIDSGIESVKKVAYDTYPELKDKELPKRWEEIEVLSGYYIDSFSKIRRIFDFFAHEDRNLLPTKELAEAVLALCQLLYLREVYRDGWKPIAGDYSCNYSVVLHNNTWQVLFLADTIFLFQNNEIAHTFKSNFSDLLNKIKPLYE